MSRGLDGGASFAEMSDEAVVEWLKRQELNKLKMELYFAELQARKGGKRKTCDTHKFELNLSEEIASLAEDLWNYEYKPSRGTAHIITEPVQREIFAAPYRDRVVHHWIINQIEEWWENRLCYESCSCRKGRGTSFGIARLNHHMQSVSDRFRKPAYVIKMDISGYFMHINRDLLYQRVKWGLDQQYVGRKDKRYSILHYALKQIIFDDPVKGCKIQGSYADWMGLPPDKSLFCQPEGMGLVIGNLTSQFCSNIYLDPLDRFITMRLGYKHYGRYVDDFYIVVTEEELPQAKRDIKAIGEFLNGLGLKLNPKKTHVYLPGQGVPFLGMVLKRGFIMPNKRVYRNFLESAHDMANGNGTIESVVSYMGLLKNYDATKVVQKIFEDVGWEYNL